MTPNLMSVNDRTAAVKVVAVCLSQLRVAPKKLIMPPAAHDALKARYDNFARIGESLDAEEAAKTKPPLNPPRANASPATSSMPNPDTMTDAQRANYLEQYAKMFSRNRPKKQDYHFPDTIDEQKVICDAADALRLRGNALFKEGQLAEAAKLYEQAVLKFADWYAECFATDEERKLVHAVKLPSHLNLAACSMKLGNLEHAVVHCSQVIGLQQHNSDALNTKAFFRRGCCHTSLGNLAEARNDLQAALKLSPADNEVRKAMAHLQRREREYGAAQRDMTRKMIAGAGGSEADVDEDTTQDPAPSVEEHPEPGPSSESGSDCEQPDDGDEQPNDGATDADAPGMDQRMERLLALLEKEDAEAAVLARQAVERRLRVGPLDQELQQASRKRIGAGAPGSVAKQWSGTMAMACLAVAISCLAAYSMGRGQ